LSPGHANAAAEEADVRGKRNALCVVAGTALFLISGAALAGSDGPFGLPAPPDPGKVFEAITSHAFDLPLPKIGELARALPDPDDVAVAAFLAARSSRPPEAIVRMRAGGVPWIDVSVRLGLPQDIYFVPVERTPGPPFGRAYGHYRRHGRTRLVLSDAEVRDLVAVRMAHDYYGVPAERAMEWRRTHHNVREVMVAEYEQRHGKHDRGQARPANDSRAERGAHRGNESHGDDHAKGKGQGHDKDSEKDRDKDSAKGHDKGHGR
jgi:hypothetical protein